jgi:hypothetical protein
LELRVGKRGRAKGMALKAKELLIVKETQYKKLLFKR